MPIDNIDHMYVETRDYPKAQAFWKTLGFEIKAEWGEDGHKACQMMSGKASLVLANSTSDNISPPTFHFAIQDADAMNAALETADNVEVTLPLENTHWGTKWIRVRDPDGNEYALEEVPK